MAKDLKKLVIVESPAKARKIGSYLGADYIVEASVGHIRDLPQRAADIANAVSDQFGITVGDLELKGLGVDSPVKVSTVKGAIPATSPSSPSSFWGSRGCRGATRNIPRNTRR